MHLQDKVVMVTGASGGIGTAIARELARHQAIVVLAARRVNVLQQLACEIDPSGQRVLVVPADLRVADDIDRLVATTVNTFGHIDILINNAGVNSPRAILKTNPRSLKKILETNLLAPTLVIHAVVPHMIQQQAGLIINIGSVAGEIATTGFYAATKFGLRGLNDSLRRELHPHGISVVLIEPGFIQTPMTARLNIKMPPPHIVAQAVIAAVRRPRHKIILPRFYVLLVFLAQHFPYFADRVILARFFRRNYSE